jgi:aspartate/methionine/tyrosine aminotransferase
MARKTKVLSLNSPNMSIDKIADFVQEGVRYPFSKDEFIKMYREWEQWDSESLRYYQDNLRIVKALLQGAATAGSPDAAGFNTFVKVQEPGNDVNSMDFLAKLMYTLGTYTQVGPCFGLSQKTWDRELGIWPRITYASSREDLIEAVTRLVVFTRFYGERNFGDPNRFPTLQIRFDQQI